MTKHLCLILSLTIGSLLSAAGLCQAEVRLPKILASHMVLQRESEVKLWGWAEPGEEVTVICSWFDKKLTFKADAEGNWQVTVKTGQAGGPHSVTIAGKNSLKLEDILFGEVWIGSGQSNMEMPLKPVSGAYSGIQAFEKEIAAADYPEIRLFQAGNYSSNKPLNDVESGIVMYGIPPADCKWQLCTPETVPTFSSTAYFFARELYKELKMPIGIIDSSWGGTSAEAWTPTEELKALGYTADLKQAAELPQQADKKVPTRLYNGMIHPLRNFKIRGVVWYQGEGNSGRANKYRELFSTMIGGWRRVFGYEFPFYFVQIAPYNYKGVNSALLRESQLQTLSTPQTGMAVTMDIANLTDIHPKNKQEVGRRLALWALAKDYGKEIAYSGPLYQGSTFADGKARVTFQHAEGGLKTNDGKAPSHFEVAGADMVFHAAKAEIDGDELVVSADQVKEPKFVRYGFTNDAQPNLVNAVGLPASSFRTDK